MPQDCVDAVVIGGGFYGLTIATYLAKTRGLKQVVVLEKESGPMLRASYNNQARVHNGYHYPRSFTTAFRSRVNLPRFVAEWPSIVKQDFTKIYAIAKRNSKVTAAQFERFCKEIGARISTASPAIKQLFEPRLIEGVFSVEEYAFDSNRLAQLVMAEINDSGVTIEFLTKALSISKSFTNSYLTVTSSKNGGVEKQIDCRYVFNCTYSGLNQFSGDFPGTQTGLKQEITEMALVEVPEELRNIGVTVMDGPFFSMMPFPSRNLHTLSHVRYTPHLNWRDANGVDPYDTLAKYDQVSRVDRMMRDVGRYMPAALKAKYVESLFEVKTVLAKNEGDDGRPILFEKYDELPGCYSVLGGKIDNIYDVLEKLETEEFKHLVETQ